jgi:transcriptional regulator of acetoin/glycerol metabolism
LSAKGATSCPSLAALVPELGLGIFTANPAPRHSPLNKSFDARIKKLHGQGMTITGMAAVLGLAPSTVCRIMKRLGLRRNSWRGKSRKRG